MDQFANSGFLRPRNRPSMLSMVADFLRVNCDAQEKQVNIAKQRLAVSKWRVWARDHQTPSEDSEQSSCTSGSLAETFCFERIRVFECQLMEYWRLLMMSLVN